MAAGRVRMREGCSVANTAAGGDKADASTAVVNCGTSVSPLTGSVVPLTSGTSIRPTNIDCCPSRNLCVCVIVRDGTTEHSLHHTTLKMQPLSSDTNPYAQGMQPNS